MNRDGQIDSLRCLCNYMIVVLHGWAAYQYCNNTTTEYHVWDFVCNVIMSSAMSVLFFLSGYLLMRNFTMSTYKKKIIRRIKRLAIPYISWNCLFVLIYISFASVFPRLNDRVVSYGLDTWHGALCKIISFVEAPIDGPLWFLRALFLYSICSPVVFYASRMGKGIFISILIAWTVISCFTGLERDLTHCYPAYSVLSFTIGCIWAGKTSNLFSCFVRGKFLLIGIGILGLSTLLFCREIHSISWRYLLWNLGMLLSGIWLLGVGNRIYHLLSGNKMFSYLQNASFFVYAGHFLFCSIPLHLIADKLSGFETGKPTILISGVFVGIGLLICLCVYSVGKRILGKSFSIFDGTL